MSWTGLERLSSMDSQTHQHQAHALQHPQHAHQHPHSHSYTLPSLSPTDFFNGLELATPTTTTTTTSSVQPGPRLYKSRKYRPCDFCRARQVACKIDQAPPCQLCSSHRRECTFVERPKKKRRPNATNGEASGSAPAGQGRISIFHADQKSCLHLTDTPSPSSLAEFRCHREPIESRLYCPV